MSKIVKQDSNGVKPLLAVGELGYDNYPSGGDIGRVYVGNGAENIPQAKKAEVVIVDGKVDTHVARIDNPHGVTKTQVGLSNVDNTADSVKVVASAGKLTTARNITLSGDVSGSVNFDGSENVSITTTIGANSVILGTDTTGNYVAGLTQGTGISITGSAGEGWSPTVSLADVGTAGTYRSVTTDAKGRITAGTNPTTVSGYGLTDVYTKTESNTSLALKVNNSEKGVANGVATLDVNGKVVLTQIPDSVLGQLEYMGTWNFATLPTSTQKGQYWIANTSGNGYVVGDWAVWNGATFDKVDNTDAVATVAGRTGNVVLTKTDVGLDNVENTSDSAKPVSTAQQAALNLKANIASPIFTGNVTGLGVATGTSFNSITGLSSVVGTTSGTAAVGASTTVARADHVHPAQTTITGNAGTASKLQTARTIGGVSFDGTVNINLPGVNAAGNQSTTGNAGSATKLATARTINGVAFDGSANITVVDSTAVKLTGNETIAGIKTFTSSPTVPTPTTNTQAANKKYVDDNIFKLSTDYYQGPYGIQWDYTTDTYRRTGARGYTAIQSQMRRCVLKADGTVNYYLNPDNSNFKEDGTSSVLTGADGNVMVEIPKHYIKVETVGNIDSFSVSLTPEAGYVLDPAFLKWNGTAMVEVPYRYFRAYEGFVSGGKLLSVSGVTPTRSQTIATFRTQAMANGDGWHLTDWNLLNTIKRLCYIEFCDFIVTKYLGEGNHTGSDYGITTGQSNALGNRSSNSTHNDKYMSYRGIENMYADIWEFVDGVNINNYQFYVNGNYSTFQSDVFAGDYVSKGPLTVAGAGNSLIKRCAVSVDGGFIPTVVGGSTTTFYGDALWSAAGAIIALYGGDTNYGASGGLGALAVDGASSNSGVNVGAAVCR